MTSLSPFYNNKTTNTEHDPLQKSLSELWAKIEKKQQRNQKFLADKEKLYTEFQTKVLPLEQQQGKEMANLVEFLIPFLTRKSLSDYQREELINWIESNLDYLRSHPFLTDVDHDDLHEQFGSAYSAFMQSQGIKIDEQQIEKVRLEIDHMFAGNLQLTDNEIIALIKNPNLLNQYIRQMNEQLDTEEENSEQAHSAHQHNEPFEDSSKDDFEPEDEHYHASQDTKQKDLDKLFKAGQLNKIYKRLATLLHPDKEQNPAKKAQKHELMQTLSEARKNKDAFTLLQLYQTHINDGEFSFDTDTLSSMQALLKEKLYLLEEEHYQAKITNDMPTLVWRKFSARSKKQTENNIKNHASNLAAEVHEQQLIMQQHTTVAQMKKLLQQRLEQNLGWVSDMPIELIDLFR